MWYIMSYNQIVGFSSGAFHDLELLFYAGPGAGDNQRWVPLVSEAMGFDSQFDAMTHAHSVWGKEHADSMFGYVSFPKSQDWRDVHARTILDTRRQFTRQLASRQMTRRELESLVPGSRDNPATPPEQWIIQAMKA